MAKELKDHNYNGIDATIIADSLSPRGPRLTTFVLTFPRSVLAEYNTHRALTRNSASSRAIPFYKMVKMAKDNPFIPIAWQKDHPGMQGKEYIEDATTARELWLRARDAAVVYSTMLNESEGVTKQICNRMLEPYMWHTIITTASEWENFFALRAHPDAEIHIAALADKMLEEYNAATPTPLKEGEWHIPFGDSFDEERVKLDSYRLADQRLNLMGVDLAKVKIATARCARVSYLNFEGKDDYVADQKLFERLAKMGHWSPFEHCARVMTYEEYRTHINGVGMGYESHSAYSEVAFNDDCEKAGDELGWSGNFRGFIQLRKMFANENKKDERVKNYE